MKEMECSNIACSLRHTCERFNAESKDVLLCSNFNGKAHCDYYIRKGSDIKSNFDLPEGFEVLFGGRK